jgi:hypothetical protein
MYTAKMNIKAIADIPDLTGFYICALPRFTYTYQGITHKSTVESIHRGRVVKSL